MTPQVSRACRVERQLGFERAAEEFLFEVFEVQAGDVTPLAFHAPGDAFGDRRDVLEVRSFHASRVVRRSSHAGGVLCEEPVPLGEVAGGVRRPQVRERRRASAGHRDYMIHVQVARLDESAAKVADVTVQLEHGCSATLHEGTVGVASSMPAHLTSRAPWVTALPRLRVEPRAFGLGRVEVAGDGRPRAPHRGCDRGERRSGFAQVTAPREGRCVHAERVGTAPATSVSVGGVRGTAVVPLYACGPVLCVLCLDAKRLKHADRTHGRASMESSHPHKTAQPLGFEGTWYRPIVRPMGAPVPCSHTNLSIDDSRRHACAGGRTRACTGGRDGRSHHRAVNESGHSDPEGRLVECSG